MTEGELSVESERTSEDILGEPGQQHEVGRLFGCPVRVNELCFLGEAFVIEKLPRRLFLMASRVPWLARTVHLIPRAALHSSHGA